MDIPLLHELQHPGFHKLSFTPLYDPLVLVLDNQKLKETRPDILGDDEPRRGVFVLIKPPIGTSINYNLYVGCAGVEREQTLYGRVQELRSISNTEGMAGWKKAILLCNWENDIQTEEGGPGEYSGKPDLIGEVMRNEAHHLIDILYTKLGKANNPKWHLAIRDIDLSCIPNPDMRRYEYYADVVMQLLQMLTENDSE